MKYKKNNYILTLILSLAIKFGLINGKKYIKLFSKILIIDLNLIGISKAIYCEKYREIDHTNIFSNKLKNKRKILDLGANIGYYMLLEAADSDQNSKIICIEPDQRNIDLLKENIKINNLDEKVTVVQAAVSGEDGSVSLNISGASNLNKIEENNPLDNDNKDSILVNSMSLNSIYEKFGYFDALRMDVEGAESVILSNNSEIFLKSMPSNSTIFMEVHPQNYIGKAKVMKDALLNLNKNGFNKFDIVTSGKKPDNEILKKLGKSEVFYKDGRFKRFHYENISFNNLQDFVIHTPKIIRYVIAEKV